jgi:hypothetical protein
MNPWVKYLLNTVLAVVVGGGIPATTGLNGWESYAASGAAAAAIAIFNLWQHKPKTDPAPKEVVK